MTGFSIAACGASDQAAIPPTEFAAAFAHINELDAMPRTGRDWAQVPPEAMLPAFVEAGGAEPPRSKIQQIPDWMTSQAKLSSSVPPRTISGKCLDVVKDLIGKETELGAAPTR
ncbi:UNVERIFIED_ORG: hypothetical protein J2R74_001594 [Bradyrhizobium japonicum]